MTASAKLEHDLFGSSSSSEEQNEQQESIDFDDDRTSSSPFELVRGSQLPKGLSLHRGALTGDTSKLLFDSLRDILDDKTQAFFFGLDSLPPWALALSRAASSRLVSSWPKKLTERVPLFDMAAINLYCSSSSGEEESGRKNDDSLKQHVDLVRFDDGVAVFSLGTTAVMRFERVVDSESEDGPGGVVGVLLREGDLLAMRGEARWEWTHGFASGDHSFKGDEILRSGGSRIGVTLRKMKREGG